MFDSTASIFPALLLVQAIHSLEELSTGFHKKWYLMHMPFWVFLTFEILFLGFWILVLMQPSFPHRDIFMTVFVVLMFLNGVQHLVWAGMAKRYVPGVGTAPLFLVLLFMAYFL